MPVFINFKCFCLNVNLSMTRKSCQTGEGPSFAIVSEGSTCSLKPKHFLSICVLKLLHFCILRQLAHDIDDGKHNAPKKKTKDTANCKVNQPLGNNALNALQHETIDLSSNLKWIFILKEKTADPNRF